MPSPRVSICIPVLNGADLITRAIDSALDQDYPNVEVVVSDDASTDGTPELVRERYGGAIKLVVHATRLGNSANGNASVEHSNGVLVKFLHHDDYLHPQCVSRMVQLFGVNAQMGLVFSRRDLELAEEGPAAAAWQSTFGEPHRNFARLEQVNSGSDLFEQCLDADFGANWIGEPSVVMVRRECLERVGLFHPYIRQFNDMDLWLRVMAYYDVGFIDEALATYRVGSEGVTSSNKADRRDWLDRLWMLEGLASTHDLAVRFPRLLEMRQAERRLAFRSVVRRIRKQAGRPLPTSPYGTYLGYRTRRRLGRAPVYGQLR